MHIEYIIYAYGILCTAMAVFNLSYSFVIKRQDNAMDAREQLLLRQIRPQMEALLRGDELNKRHTAYLKKKLSNIRYLQALDALLRQYDRDAEEAELAHYRERMQPVLLYLCRVYRKKPALQAAYFAYFLSKHQAILTEHPTELADIILPYMTKDSLYCKLNTLEALYAFGTPEQVADAIKMQDRQRSDISDKILADGLLSFHGDHAALIAILWKSLEEFSLSTQIAVLNYIKFKSGAYCSEFFSILKNPLQHMELRLCTIRYFAKYYYEPARMELLSFLEENSTLPWEFAAVSATALAQYSGSDVTEHLYTALQNKNWYVRYNALSTLQAQGISLPDTAAIFQDGLSGLARQPADVL